MSKSIKPKDNVYIDSKGIVHNRERLDNILNAKIDYHGFGRSFNSLKDFIEVTAIGDMMCGMAKLYNTNDFFNINLDDWVKVIYMYQNDYTSGWDVNGIAFVSGQSGTTWLISLHGSNGTYTATPTQLN